LESYPEFNDLIYPNGMQSEDENQCQKGELVGVAIGADQSA